MISRIASQPQYAAHLDPLWAALPAEIKGPGDAVIVASARDLASVRRRYRRVAYMEHGIGQSYGPTNRNPAYPGGRGRDTVDLFLSPNATAAAADRAAYPSARVEIVGDPRLDTLPARVPGPPCVAIAWHWDHPGWKPWPLSALRHYKGVLAELAAAFPLLGHAHPMASGSAAAMYRNLGIEFTPDFDEVCRRADLFIADNTSCLYEFASTGRPVVVLNSPEWDRSIELGLRFWAAAGVGINVEQPADLIPAVERALTDPPEVRAERQAALDVAYGFRTGAAQRAADVVMDWLGAGAVQRRPTAVARTDTGLRQVILVPRRLDNGPRDVLWSWCRAWWEREQSHMPIIEGHHDDGLFNRSAAVNRAATLAGDWDVAVIIDSDVICNPERVKAAVAIAHETGQMVLPHDVRKDLNLRGTQQVMAGLARSWEPFVHKRYPDMVSGVVVIPRRLWDEVGGFDESFVGWGYEDSAAAAAFQTFGEGIVRMPGELWHLWHPTAKEGRPGTLTWSINSAKGQRYRAAIGNRDAIRALQAEGRPVVAAEHRAAGIPPILHRVVPEVPDPRSEAWWIQFRQLHPDWTLLTHRDPLEPADWPETSGKWSACANGAQLADLVRLEALLRWGGIYLDSDVQPIRALDPLLPLSAFAAWEDERTVPNAVMGAVPGHPAIRACLDLALSRIPGDTWQAGPGVTTQVFVGRSDVLLLPPESFYPVWYRDPDRDAKMRDFDPRRHPATFVVHHYWYSWKPVVERELVAV